MVLETLGLYDYRTLSTSHQSGVTILVGNYICIPIRFRIYSSQQYKILSSKSRTYIKVTPLPFHV